MCSGKEKQVGFLSHVPSGFFARLHNLAVKKSVKVEHSASQIFPEVLSGFSPACVGVYSQRARLENAYSKQRVLQKYRWLPRGSDPRKRAMEKPSAGGRAQAKMIDLIDVFNE